MLLPALQWFRPKNSSWNLPAELISTPHASGTHFCQSCIIIMSQIHYFLSIPIAIAFLSQLPKGFPSLWTYTSHPSFTRLPEWSSFVISDCLLMKGVRIPFCRVYIRLPLTLPTLLLSSPFIFTYCKPFLFLNLLCYYPYLFLPKTHLLMPTFFFPLKSGVQFIPEDSGHA